MKNLKNILATFEGCLGATQKELNTLCQITTISLPKDYLNFLRLTNGGEGTIGQTYLALWSVKDLIDLNVAYHVSEYTPGLFLIGTDGGSEAFGYDLNDPTQPIIMVPLMLDPEYVKKIAPTFTAFLSDLHLNTIDLSP
jgi:hypothetical protein